MRFTSRSQEQAVLRVLVSITGHSVEALSIGVMVSGISVLVVLVENCVGSPIPSARGIAIGQNCPMRCCSSLRLPVFGG
jgi:hypothetical protein